jgi:hypothetical protein
MGTGGTGPAQGGASAVDGSTGGAGGAVPSGGAGGGDPGSGGGAGSAQPASFATVREIVNATCGGSDCHQPGGTPPALLTDDARLYANLLSFVAKACGGHVLIKPGAPQESAFYLVQTGGCDDPSFKMPLGCVDRCTPPDYLEGVRQWIIQGAPRE